MNIRLFNQKDFAAGCLWLLCAATVASASSPLQWTTRLENGMTLVIVEDHSCPLAASVITIRAGSHTESMSSSGISHLLEHLLFDGTTTRSGAELKSEVPARGGYFNAFTRKDYVAFEIVMPSESFLNGLEIQADQILNSTIPEGEIIREKMVVCEEIAQDVRNASGAAENAAMGILFGDSGYALPVIGSYQTVQDVSREEILGFYRSRYVPNRMTAVVTGDVDPQQVLETFRKLYGSIPAGLDNAGPMQVPSFPPESTRQSVRRPVKDSAVSIILPAPAITDPLYRSFELAVAIWADSPGSPLQIRMKPHVAQVSAWVSPHQGFSLLMIAVIPDTEKISENPNEALLQLEQALLQSIGDFIASVPSEIEIAQRIRSNRVEHEFSREKSNHLARDIGLLATLGALDDYWLFSEKIRAVNAENATYAFQQWLGSAQPVSVLVEPDQSATEAGPVRADGPQVRTLSNGLTVISLHDPYADLAAIHLLVPNPKPEIAGVPRIVAELLDAGTRDKTSEQIEQEILNRGIRTKLADWPWLPFDDYYDSIEHNYIQMECLAEDFEAALELMSQMAFTSVLPDEAWMSETPAMRKLAEDAETSSSATSRNLLRKTMFRSEFHRQSRIPDVAGIDSVSGDTLRAYHQQAYRPSACVVSIAGNLRPEAVFATAERIFGSLASEPPVEAPVVAFEAPGRGFAPVDDPVTTIRAALPLDVSPESIPEWSVIAAVLSEQLQQDIRGRRGKSYRLGAWLNEMKGCTFLEIAVGTRGENLAEVEAAAREIVDGIRNMTVESVRDAVNSQTGHEWRYRQRRINRAYFLAWRYWMGYGVDFENTYLDRLRMVDVVRVNELIQTIRPSDQWFWAVAGRADENSASAGSER